MEGDKKPEGEGVEDFSKGPLSVLWHSVKNNTQVRFCVLGFHGVYVYDSPSSAFGIQPPSTQPSTPTDNKHPPNQTQTGAGERPEQPQAARARQGVRPPLQPVRACACVC